MKPTWLNESIKTSMQVFGFLTNIAENEAKMETNMQEFRRLFGLPSQDASKEAKWRPRSSKMEPTWCQNGAQREPSGEKMELQAGRN